MNEDKWMEEKGGEFPEENGWLGCGKLPERSSIALFTFRPWKPSLHVSVPPLLPPSSSVLRYSGPLPVAVDVSRCHRVAKVGPHLEHITGTTPLACNHTNVLTSFLSFSFTLSIFSISVLHHPQRFSYLVSTQVNNTTRNKAFKLLFSSHIHTHTSSCRK